MITGPTASDIKRHHKGVFNDRMTRLAIRYNTGLITWDERNAAVEAAWQDYRQAMLAAGLPDPEDTP